ncbi:p-loop containing nucleoside triphosphate hydrolase protein [Mycena kentingensis (nom. inval.)]|nr:p-loop containing nucleoside triphosphate hydrolase protein [Mycena kentingensis (nom. inval.)]
MPPKRMKGTVYLQFGSQTKLVLASKMRESHPDVLRLVNRHFPETRGKSVDIKVDLDVAGVVITPDVWCVFADSEESKDVAMYTIELGTEPLPESFPPVAKLLAPPPEPAKPSSEPSKITLNIHGDDGKTLQVRLSTTSQLDKLPAFVERAWGISLNDFRLNYDGMYIRSGETPATLQMEDGDVLDVIRQRKGGKPVIYLRTSTQLDATVEVGLVPDWSFSVLYPVVAPTTPKDPRLHQSVSWSVRTEKDGTMLDKMTRAHVSYLFWEALYLPPFTSFQSAVVVSGSSRYGTKE